MVSRGILHIVSLRAESSRAKCGAKKLRPGCETAASRNDVNVFICFSVYTKWVNTSGSCFGDMFMGFDSEEKYREIFFHRNVVLLLELFSSSFRPVQVWEQIIQFLQQNYSALHFFFQIM